MPVVTLTTDYGLTDHRVAAIKGSLLSANESTKIVDISHNIEAYNLLHTAYILKNVHPYFPNGTVHLVAVDSFYNKNRKSLLYLVNNQFFIAADNGVLSLVFNEIKPEAIYEITLNNRFDDIVNFTATDIFVPVANHLLNGGLPEVIGRKTKSVKQITQLQPTFNSVEKMIIGDIMYIDHFGNIVTNIKKEYFEKEAAVYKNFKIKLRSFSLNKIYQSYTEIITDWKKENEFHGKAVAIFNEAGFLEITIYKGSQHNGASSLLGLGYDDNIYIEFE